MEELLNIDIPPFFWTRIIITGMLLILNPSSKYLIKRFITHTGILESKSEMRIIQIIRLANMIINLSFVVTLAIIWGVDPSRMLLVFSSVFAVIGVALFAQWSILSNITAGVVMFFSFPYKIGDKIRIQDKDFPIEARIEDIRAFHTMLLTTEGEYISYPNSLFLQKSVVILDQEV